MKLVLNGILLSKIDYSESSLILKFFTKEEGLVSFLFQGGKKKKGNALFPLSIAEINCYKRSDSSLSKISGIDILAVDQELFFNPIRSSILFFVAEICAATIQNEEEDLALYTFLENEIAFIHETKEFTNYPIYFLLNYSKYLGFYPQPLAEASFFDLEEGEFTVGKPVGHKYVKDESIPILNNLVNKHPAEILASDIPKKQRKQIVQNLLIYYRYHQAGFKELKSIQVLEELI
jgi:DNA repair protein RecO (recombination protein O)